jgi:gamma-glutamyl hercynylcysteine S-oxide synthase
MNIANHTGTPMDSPAMREAGRELLSLALIDARNHTLHLLGLLEQSAGPAAFAAHWLAGHVGWFAEYWIARNTLRALGSACPQVPTRLASIEPQADRWYAIQLSGSVSQANGLQIPPTADGDLPSPGALRAYLLDTLEICLDLLAKTPDEAQALYFFRVALFHEDLRGEQLVELAQSHGVQLRLSLPSGYPPREPLLIPAQRWTLGTAPSSTQLGHFTFDREKWAHEVSVPEFEIDAHPVTWAQFIEFVTDGGYDRAELWHPQGWQWVTQHHRRAPRHVEQIGLARQGLMTQGTSVGSGAVMQTLFGKTTRMASNQAALHISWWAADAWARWAGRRLPSEAEWELAAHQAARRGFQWGGVHEWMAGTLRTFAGFTADPWSNPQPIESGSPRVLRGASFATRARLHDAKFRGFAPPGFDVGFVGFRSCAV